MILSTPLHPKSSSHLELLTSDMPCKRSFQHLYTPTHRALALYQTLIPWSTFNASAFQRLIAPRAGVAGQGLTVSLSTPLHSKGSLRLWALKPLS